MPFPLTPWGFTFPDRDRESYLVIRGVDYRPVAYVERGLSQEDEKAVALLIARAPELLDVLKQGAFANTASWGKPEWYSWQQKAKLAMDGLLK